MTKVKICGITTVADAMMAVEAGADALGFVFYDQSPRNLEPAQAAEIIRVLPPFVQVVGLFVHAPLDFINTVTDRCRLDVVQLHGDEPPEFCAGVNRRVIKLSGSRTSPAWTTWMNTMWPDICWMPGHQSLRRYRRHLQLGYGIDGQEVWPDHPCGRSDPGKCGGSRPLRVSIWGRCLKRCGSGPPGQGSGKGAAVHPAGQGMFRFYVKFEVRRLI